MHKISYSSGMKTLYLSVGVCLVAIYSFVMPSIAAEPRDEAAQLAGWSADRDQRMSWWREARFGMFIHWGLYSGAGGAWDGKVYPQHYAEWIQHWAAVPCDQYARAMKPLFAPDPGVTDSWADLAKDAGMRYAVLTSKHHDGFTLFNSAHAYSLANPITGGTNISPAGRDVAREFADSMRSRGLRAGFYYSLLDWQHPDAYEMALPAYPKSPRTRDHAEYIAYVRNHVNELLSNYGPLCTIWFDYSDKQRQGAAWGASNLLADMRAKQPNILVNNRLFEGLENKNGDYGTPEKYVPPTGLPGMDWEVNHTLNESYGYSSHDTHWKDSTTVVRLLCDVVSKGGNLLLNIGPDAHGRVPAPAEAALRGVGVWMRVNSDAIYGTAPSPFIRLPWGCATQKPGVLYLMVFDWPADGRLIVPMKGAIKSARLLGHEGELSFDRKMGEVPWLEVRLPKHPIDAACSVVRLELDGDVLPTPFVVFPKSNGVLSLRPHDATLNGPSLRVEQVGAVENVQYNLGYWLDTVATASFPIGIGADQQGEYAVEMEVGCADASAGATMTLKTPSGDLGFTVPATGGWQQYRVMEVGRVTLLPGSHVLTLAALTKPGEAVVNVRTITLRLRERKPVRLDLDADVAGQVVVDREAGVYLGHVSTILLDDQKTILAAYPKGHGKGPIVLKRSDDGGGTWSPRLATPTSWETSKETPTLFNLGGGSLILFSGLYPIRAARSGDSGATWSELSPIGEFGGIVAMGGVARRGEGKFAAFFHDDGRYFHADGKAAGVFTVYQSNSDDEGATWQTPRAIWSGSEVHLCEPGVVVSPDGGTIALLLRENRRRKNSHIMFSTDQTATWSGPFELPSFLTGDRHTATYSTDGRLVVTFRCMANDEPWRGDWVAWVGGWNDIARAAGPDAKIDARASAKTTATTRASYFVRLKNNFGEWDCGYPGLECLPDGTLVATTYGTWEAGEKPSILCVRFTLAELDAKAAKAVRQERAESSSIGH